jgi:hypothetical protein
MKEPTQFITNDKGERIAVIGGIEDYEEMIETIEDLLDIRAIDEAKASVKFLSLLNRRCRKIVATANELATSCCRPFSRSLPSYFSHSFTSLLFIQRVCLGVFPVDFSK